MAQAMAIYLVSCAWLYASQKKTRQCALLALANNDGQCAARCNNPEVLLCRLLTLTICRGKVAPCGDMHFTGVPLHGQPPVACP
jgi:hypothetical protein